MLAFDDGSEESHDGMKLRGSDFCGTFTVKYHILLHNYPILLRLSVNVL